jgi:hypothetical protein
MLGQKFKCFDYRFSMMISLCLQVSVLLSFPNGENNQILAVVKHAADNKYRHMLKLYLTNRLILEGPFLYAIQAPYLA